MPVVVDELNHRVEGQGVRETVLPVAVEDFDQFVVTAFPVSGTKKGFNFIARSTHCTQVVKMGHIILKFKKTYTLTKRHLKEEKKDRLE